MSTLATSILIVRHGPGLGGCARYGERVLDWVRRNDPALAGRILVHETGTGALPTAAAGAGAVVFWMAAPLRERYPACYREASAIAELAVRRGARMVNPPAALSNADPGTRARLWEQVGVPCATPRRFQTREELEALLDGMPTPVIVRPEPMHAAPMRLAKTRGDAIAAALGGVRCAGTVTSFVDTREGYRRGDPGSVWGQLYHRKRAYVFGDVVIPGDVVFSSSPLVSWAGSTFQRYEGWRSLLQGLAYLRRLDRDAVAADLAFAQVAPEPPALLRRAAAALDLDFLTIDYATPADGGTVLWDVDPRPEIPEWHRSGMPLVRRTLPRLNRIYAAAAAFLRGLIHDSIDHRRTA